MESAADYTFKDDWFSMRIPTFEKHVGPLAGSPCSLLEIGAHEGRATTWLIDNVLSHPDARLDAIDVRLSDTLKHNVALTGHAHKVHLHEGASRRLLKTLPVNSYDFIYVDGSHQTIDVLEDAVLAFQRARTGGIIAFDDYLWDTPPLNAFGVPKPAIDAFLALYARPSRYKALVEILESDWQVWTRKRYDSAYAD